MNTWQGLVSATIQTSNHQYVDTFCNITVPRFVWFGTAPARLTNTLRQLLSVPSLQAAGAKAAIRAEWHKPLVLHSWAWPGHKKATKPHASHSPRNEGQHEASSSNNTQIRRQCDNGCILRGVVIVQWFQSLSIKINNPYSSFSTILRYLCLHKHLNLIWLDPTFEKEILHFLLQVYLISQL